MSSEGRTGGGGGGRSRSRRGGGRSGRGGRGGRGRGDRDGDPGANFAGRGPKHFGAGTSRPERIEPRLPGDSSDEEIVEDKKMPARSGGGGNTDDRTHLDHLAPISASPNQPTAEAVDVDHVAPVNASHRGGEARERHAYCLVCYSSKLHLRRTIAPCGHDDVCELQKCALGRMGGVG